MNLGGSLVDLVVADDAPIVCVAAKNFVSPHVVSPSAVARRSNSSRSPGKGDKKRRRAQLGFESLEIRNVLSGAGILSGVSSMWFQTIQPFAHFDSGGSYGADAAGEQGDASIGAGAGNLTDTYDWIVNFNAAAVAGLSSVADTLSLFGDGIEVEVLQGLGLVGQVLVRTRGADTLSVGEWLSSNSAIAGFEQDIVRVLQATPNDTSFGTLYGLHNTGQSGGTADADIDAPEAWNLTTGSSSVVAGIIDTGIDYTHPDLVGNMWTNPGEIAGNGIDDDGNGFVDDVHGYDFYNEDGDPMDDNSHGTHVAGTVGATGDNGQGVVGVAWNVKLMALKFMGASGSGYTSDAVRAVNYATMMRSTYGVNVRVLNNSWGSGSYSYSLESAISASNTAGILFVAAAGNDGTDNDTTPHYPSNFSPANVISVASTDRNDTRSSFSNWGATTVDLGAPGSSIYSTVPGGGYGTKSGTSMATPHVTGAAVLAWAYNPNLTVAQVKAAILNSVDANSSLAGITVTGGRLNVNNMLQSLTAGGNPNFQFSGSTLTVQGTSGADTFEFVHGNGGQHTVIYNGSSVAVDHTVISTIRFEGAGGADSAIVRGSNGVDTATLNVGGGTMSGSGWAVIMVSIETIDLYGGAGDSATLNDSSGNDALTAYYNQVTLSGSGYSNKARSFGAVYVVATTGTDTATLYDTSGNDVAVAQSGYAYMYGTGYLNHVTKFDTVTFNASSGFDIVYMYDSTGNDTFTGRYNTATFSGSGWNNTVNGFDNVYGIANQGGTDTANLYDSTGSDTFVFTMDHAYIVGGVGQFNFAEHFENVYAFAQNGGLDVAHMFDSAGNDTFRAYESYAEMTGSGKYGQANGWDLVYGRAENGGNDTAYLYDTSASDTLVMNSQYAYVTWSGFLNFARGFDSVYAVSSNGGNDIAHLFDSAGNDSFTGTSTYSLMTGTGFYNHVTGYKTIYVRAQSGGVDTATLNGSTGNDTFIARQSSVYLHNSTYHHEVWGFDNVYAVATQGGYDEAYLFDTSGDDAFVGRKDYSYLSGSGLLHHAAGFDYVFSSSVNGGNDTATFYDSAGNDNFTAGTDYAYMVGSGFTNNTTGYKTVRAECTTGTDQAFLYDSTGNDTLSASGNSAILTSTGRSITVVKFDRANANGTNGGTNTATQSTIDYVLEKIGTWS
ncbi:MAG: S8 family peptidase [Pirellulales bacterium]